MSQMLQLSLATPLTCGAIRGSAMCGNLAWAAYASKADSLPGWQQLGLTPGELVILPVCDQCARALLQKGGNNKAKTLMARSTLY